MKIDVKNLYDMLCDAVEGESERGDEARRVVSTIAHEVGVDLSTDVEGDEVWSHANMLRVVRGVRALRHEVARHRGLPVGGFAGNNAPDDLVGAGDRGW